SRRASLAASSFTWALAGIARPSNSDSPRNGSPMDPEQSSKMIHIAGTFFLSGDQPLNGKAALDPVRAPPAGGRVPSLAVPVQPPAPGLILASPAGVATGTLLALCWQSTRAAPTTARGRCRRRGSGSGGSAGCGSAG